MKEKLQALFKDKKQRGYLVWLAALCVLAAAVAAFFVLCAYNEEKKAFVVAFSMLGKKQALLAAAVAVLAVAVAGLFLRLRPAGGPLAKKAAWKRWLALALYSLISTFVLDFAGEIVIKGLLPALQWLPEYFVHFLRSWAWLLLLYLFFACLANGWVASLITGAVTILPGIISYFKLAYRGNPVFPWDIYALGTFADISDGIALDWTLAILLALALWALAVAAAVPLRFAWPWRERKKALKPAESAAASPKSRRFPMPLRRGVAVLCAALLWWGYTDTAYFNAKYALAVSGWTADVVYKREGQLTAFLTDIKMLRPQAPPGYSLAALEGMLQQMAPQTMAASDGAAVPNIVMVMGESFWDAQTVLPGIQFGEELLPNWRRLQSEAVSGDLLVSIFGGGTSTTEFQTLTGFTTQFFPAEYTPYMQAVRAPFFSYAQYLKNQGYDTAAMHAHYGKNWNRSTAYPHLGFDVFYYVKDKNGSFIEKETERGRRSDSHMFDEMIRRYEEHLASSNAPLFLFGVTIQNHPGYRADRYEPDQWFPFEAPGASEETVNQLRDIATGLHSADAALGELVAYFEAREEPVLLIYFGDHQSLNKNTLQTVHAELGLAGSQPSELDARADSYRVPFIAWSNEGKNPVQNTGTIAAYNLLPMVLQAYGLPMPQYFEYLLEMSEISPGFENGLTLLPGGSYVPFGEGSEAQQAAARQHEWLQYDYIFGNKYARGLFMDGEVVQ